MMSIESYNLMPTNSPSPVSSDSFPEPDLLTSLEGDSNEDGLIDGLSKRKSRRPPSTAERRATHNAVERARRESLNGRFMDLAGALPNMANVKRPSKSVIVAKSLEFVQGAQAREQYLMSQNDTLRQEINDLRARLGMPAISASPMPMSNAMALPMMNPSHVNRSRKASSVSSSTGDSNGSPHLGTPVTSFEHPTGFAFNQAFANSFPGTVPPSAVSAVTPPAVHTELGQAQIKTPTPVTASFPGQTSPALDVNYLMALSLQQQQQQQSLMMQNVAPSYTAVAPWLMPRGAAPQVAVGGDGQWLFN